MDTHLLSTHVHALNISSCDRLHLHNDPVNAFAKDCCFLGSMHFRYMIQTKPDKTAATNYLVNCSLTPLMPVSVVHMCQEC